jgi:hypothetical protein
VKPGFHTFEFGKSIGFQFEPGRSYYLQVSGRTFGFNARNELRVMTEAAAQADMTKHDMMPIDPDRVFDTECRGAAATPGR